MTNKTFYCAETDHTFDVEFEAGKLEIMRLVGHSELETMPISAKVFKKIARQLEIEELKQKIAEIESGLDEEEKARAVNILEQLNSDKLRDSQLALLAEEIDDLSVKPSETSNQIL